VAALRTSGLDFKGIERYITWIERNGVKYKLYEDKGVVEMETGVKERLEELIDLFRGRLIFKSYYTGTRLCGD
jgi:hypothetical protein